MNHYDCKIKYDCACKDISIDTWNGLMKGAVKANGLKIRRMIKKQLPDLYYTLALEYFNPYEHLCQRTKTHLIYVHSGIEYFLRIID